MKKTVKNLIFTVVGVLFLGVGLYLIKSISEPQGILKALPYVCVGFGCGLFGHGMGNVISEKAIRTNPGLQQQMEIEKNDERNLAIGNKAKAKAYDLMTFVFGALLIAFALMGVETIAVLLLVFAYLFVHGYAIFYRLKYDKEM